MKPIPSSAPRNQHGVVLIISLVLLFTLTLIAVSSMGTSRLEQQMTANMRDRQIAFQAAESALRDGERFVQNTPLTNGNFDTNCTNGLCLCTGSCTTEYWTDTGLNVWNTAGKYKKYSGTKIGNKYAEYIVEYMGQSCDPVSGCPSPPTYMYRITALGYGQTSAARVMLQSTYLK